VTNPSYFSYPMFQLTLNWILQQHHPQYRYSRSTYFLLSFAYQSFIVDFSKLLVYCSYFESLPNFTMNMTMQGSIYEVEI